MIYFNISKLITEDVLEIHLIEEIWILDNFMWHFFLLLHATTALLWLYYGFIWDYRSLGKSLRNSIFGKVAAFGAFFFELIDHYTDYYAAFEIFHSSRICSIGSVLSLMIPIGVLLIISINAYVNDGSFKRPFYYLLKYFNYDMDEANGEEKLARRVGFAILENVPQFLILFFNVYNIGMTLSW